VRNRRCTNLEPFRSKPSAPPGAAQHYKLRCSPQDGLLVALNDPRKHVQQYEFGRLYKLESTYPAYSDQKQHLHVAEANDHLFITALHREKPAQNSNATKLHWASRLLIRKALRACLEQEKPVLFHAPSSKHVHENDLGSHIRSLLPELGLKATELSEAEQGKFGVPKGATVLKIKARE